MDKESLKKYRFFQDVESFSARKTPLYLTYDFPEYERVNKNLKKFIIYNLHNDVLGEAKRTAFNLHRLNNQLHPAVRQILQFLHDNLQDVAVQFAIGEDSNTTMERRKNDLNWNWQDIGLAECWGIYYDKGQGVITHNHFPFTLSFCYCVSAPEGSAPLILNDYEGKDVKLYPKEGRLTIFLASTWHRVCPNDQKADGRCSLVGNYVYAPRFLQA